MLGCSGFSNYHHSIWVPHKYEWIYPHPISCMVAEWLRHLTIILMVAALNLAWSNTERPPPFHPVAEMGTCSIVLGQSKLVGGDAGYTFPWVMLAVKLTCLNRISQMIFIGSGELWSLIRQGRITRIWGTGEEVICLRSCSESVPKPGFEPTSPES